MRRHRGLYSRKMPTLPERRSPGSAADDSSRNRWAIAGAAAVMQLCLGAVYGWSVFVKPLEAAEHWSLKEITLTFQLAIAALGIGTVVGGLWQDRVGPRRVGTVAGVLYGIGYLVAGWAVGAHSLGALYAGYGVIAGLGMG